MIKSLCLASLLTLACAAPVAAQDHSHHHMAAPMATAPKAGQAPATDFLADQAYDPVVMARAREVMRFEHGGMPMSKVSANLLEYQARSGEDGYRWEGEAWYGGDLHRLVFKTQGEGGTRSGLEAAEVQALYSRAIGPFTDLQVGLRQDVKLGPAQTYGAFSLETILPYWIHAQGGLYLSPRGNLLARVEGAYDLRLTQRLILQPRAELNFAAQDMPSQEIGSGLSKAELGLRLRYELHREFAPYVGVTYDQSFGHTADFARAEGLEVKSTGVVVGIRSWF